MTILTERALATKLNLSYWTVRRMRLDGSIRFFSVGNRIYYKYEDVCADLTQKSSKTNDKTDCVSEQTCCNIGKIRQIN